MDCYWEKTRVLGSGSYATVHLARPSGNSGATGPVMAVKSTEDVKKMESLKWELRVLEHLAGAPNVVRCYGHDISLDTEKGTYNLLLEYAPEGTLHTLIRRSSLKEAQVACYARMILKGLAGAHSRGIVHCDLKPANILVFPGPCKEFSSLKLADFGLARAAEEEEGRVVFWEGPSRKYYNRGTAMYSSPESVEWGRHEKCTDIWSFGCVVHEMFTGSRIWKWNGDLEELYQQILQGSYAVPPGLSEAAVHFLTRCLERTAVIRWSAEELLEHPFITNNLRTMSAAFGVDLNQTVEQEDRVVLNRDRHLFSGWLKEAVERMDEARTTQQGAS